MHDLERQVNQNSQNSSQPPSLPPSRDGCRKPAPKSLRGKTDKPSGGQPGTRLEMREDPDHIMVHRPTQCDGCGQELDSGSVVDAARRQVYDLVARIEVTEHQAVTVACPHCQATTAAPFPATIPAPVQYGPALKSFLSYGSVYQLLPVARLMELLADLTGHRISEGTLFNALEIMNDRLEPFEQDIKTVLLGEPVVHFDESGLRVGKTNHWIHSASSQDATYY